MCDLIWRRLSVFLRPGIEAFILKALFLGGIALPRVYICAEKPRFQV